MTSQERKDRLNEISKYVVSIPSNPDTQGYTALFQILSALSSYYDRVCSILREGIEDKFNVEKKIALAKEEYENEKNAMLLKDEIRILKSSELRVAAVDVQLINKKKVITQLEIDQQEVQTFINEVSLVFEGIKDKIRTIKRQIEIGVLMNGIGEIEKSEIDKKVRI
jgi:hypothetical protein